MSALVRREFLAELIGQVNGQPIELYGGGEIDHVSGITRGSYSLKQCPKSFDPALLSGCLITGYPNVCATKTDIENPFAQSNYRYARILKFRNGGLLSLHAECNNEGAKLISKFTIEATVQTQSLASVEPITETWQPRRNRTINGKFSIGWRSNEGHLVAAEAETIYEIQNEFRLENPLYRYMEIVPKTLDHTLHLYQESELFADGADAKRPRV